MTARTAMLEARWLWGDEALGAEPSPVSAPKSLPGTSRDYVAAKLAERDERHRRMGDSRYVVEPNVKDGKGGLARSPHALLDRPICVRRDQPRRPCRQRPVHQRRVPPLRTRRAFFWAVRCHLHLAAGRAEERLGFDMQRTIAGAMRYADRPGKSAVERFMQFYFLNAKTVGDLTGLFLAQLDEQMGETGAASRCRASPPTAPPQRLHPRSRPPVDPGRRLVRRSGAADRIVRAGRARRARNPPRRDARRRPRRAQRRQRSRRPRANALFLEVLTNRDQPDMVLRWMNEAGVFGRFVPDFGRIVAQMQFDMYHHYTVDEHSIRAIGLLAAIERGELADDHPLSTALVPPARLAPLALCRGAAPRHRQGPRRRP